MKKEDFGVIETQLSTKGKNYEIIIEHYQEAIESVQIKKAEICSLNSIIEMLKKELRQLKVIIPSYFYSIQILV